VRILALDTASAFGSIALLEDDETIDERWMHSDEGFSHTLFSHIEEALGNAGWAAGSIDCFAAGSGPGSFTGVRVALAAAKGLAEPGKRAVAGVSNLQALASFGTAPLRAALLDARRGEVYAALYRADLSVRQPEEVGPLPEWLKRLPDEEIEFLVQDVNFAREALRGTRFESAPVRPVPRALAAAIGRLAAAEIRKGGAPESAGVDANYVRRSDAELFWRDRV
jgi:tRNA threonylcarbamoyladenosine biosynthesis protein TsaB